MYIIFLYGLQSVNLWMQLFIKAAFHRNSFSSKRLFIQPTQRWLIHHINKCVGSMKWKWLFTFWLIHRKYYKVKNLSYYAVFYGNLKLQSELLYLVQIKVMDIQSEMGRASHGRSDATKLIIAKSSAASPASGSREVGQLQKHPWVSMFILIRQLCHGNVYVLNITSRQFITLHCIFPCVYGVCSCLYMPILSSQILQVKMVQN